MKRIIYLISYSKCEIKTSTDWSGIRICILKGVRRTDDAADRRVILNDFHLLPTNGYAGIRRISNNIKKYYYWQMRICDKM